MNHYITSILASVESYGAFVVFGALILENVPVVGFFVPGLTVLIFAGYIAAGQSTEIFTLFTAAVAAILVGDNIAFFIGRCGINRLPWVRKVLDQNRRSVKIIRRQSSFFLIFYQFPVYFRSIAPLVFGAIRMSLAKWWFINVFGTMLFTTVFFVVGYTIGQLHRQIEEGVEASKYIQFGFGVLGVIWLVWLVRKICRYRRSE